MILTWKKDYCDMDEEEEEEEDEDEMQSLRQREKNIQENKAMLAKLLSELTPFNTPQKRRNNVEIVIRRRNPPRRCRQAIVIRRRRNPPRRCRQAVNFSIEEKSVSKPEIVVRRNPPSKCRPAVNFSMEEKSVSPGWWEARGCMTDIKRLVEVDEEYVEKRKKCYVEKQPSVVRSVEEITKEDLDNIAYCRQDKIWAGNGSSCHQCRQKTLDTKTSCRSGVCESVRGQVCGMCLKSRYGEDAKTALLDPTWSCPKCRGMCNCSRCRRSEGRLPTGILWDLAGHDNAHAYLQWIQKEQAGWAQ